MVNVTQQASIVSMNRECSVAPCQLSTVGRGRRNAIQLDECPIRADCRPAENQDDGDANEPPDIGMCGCCPEKFKQMLKQALAEKANNLKSTGCGGIEFDLPLESVINENNYLNGIFLFLIDYVYYSFNFGYFSCDIIYYILKIN